MGRERSMIAVFLTAVIAAGCGSPERPESRADLLLISTRGGGVAVTEAGASEPVFSGRNSTPSADWKTVVRSQQLGNTTKLIAFEPHTGVHRWETVVGDSQRVKIVSGDGTLVAASPKGERGYLRGRTITTLTVAGSARLEPRSYELEGNFEPEAFSTDGNHLFLVSYLPAKKPVNYQVRRLDLETGKVEGVYTPDAHLQEEMGGTARIQAASPDGSRLYTLYTVDDSSGSPPRAFVHVLDLDELWAHCIELPEGFEASSGETAAVTVASDGAHAYLADSNSEALVAIDTETLQVSRVGTVDLDIAMGTYLLDAPGDTLYAASGTDVIAVDATTLEERKAWQMFSSVSGLQVGADPNMLYVGVDDRIIVLDVSTGARLDSINPKGVRRLGTLGNVIPAIPDEEEYLTCAC